MPDIIIIEEADVHEYFRLLLSRRVNSRRRISHGALAVELNVAQSTVTRNAARLRRGESLASKFHNKLERRLIGARLESFSNEHLRLLEKSRQAALREKEHRESVAREEAKAKEEREARRMEAEKRAKEAAERARTRQLKEEQHRRDMARNALAPWQEKLRSAGVISEDDDELYGDAKELVEAGISDLRFASEGVAFVALAPDSYGFSCGMTASELRAGISPFQRLGRDAVPTGSFRPAELGNRAAFCVPRVPYPDSEVFYASDYSEIQEWEALTNRVKYLTSGSLPWLVSPVDVAMYERLMALEHQSLYTFEGSILGKHPENRLLELRRRAKVRCVSLSAAKILMAISALSVIGLICWAMWKAFWWTLNVIGRALNAAAGWLAEGFRETGNWLEQAWPILGAIGLAILVIALVIWWIVPKANDKPGMARNRLLVACLAALILAIVVGASIYIPIQIAERLNR